MIDLYCCEGGCSEGYSRAGFEIVGVDIQPQPRYPFEFYQADALSFLSEHWREFDAVAASPPCQHYANVTAWRGDRATHPDLVAATRDALNATGLPWVIENVPEAPVRPDFLLCGSMFGLPVRRHRVFETNWPASYLVPSCAHRPTDLAFEHKGERAYADALGCDWMTNRGGRQAIPPAYCEFIGQQLMLFLGLDGEHARRDSSPARTRGSDASPGRRTDSRLRMGGPWGNGSFGRSPRTVFGGTATCSSASSTGRGGRD